MSRSAMRSARVGVLRVRPFTLPKHAFGDQGPCWACMTGLRTARVPVPARGGCFDPLQKVSANPYFNSTSFPPLIPLRSRRSVAVLGMGEDGSNDAERSTRGRQRPSVEGGGGAPKYPTKLVTVLETHAPRAGSVRVDGRRPRGVHEARAGWLGAVPCDLGKAPGPRGPRKAAASVG
eukprot:scaffold12992_cov58-Phaeocystis_antarctica.AAC.9